MRVKGGGRAAGRPLLGPPPTSRGRAPGALRSGGCFGDFRGAALRASRAVLHVRARRRGHSRPRPRPQPKTEARGSCPSGGPSGAHDPGCAPGSSPFTIGRQLRGDASVRPPGGRVKPQVAALGEARGQAPERPGNVCLCSPPPR